MSLSCWFGDTVSATGFQDNTYRKRQVCSMAWRYKDGLRVFFCSQNNTNNFIFIDKFRVCSCGIFHTAVFTYQPTFCTPNGRFIENQCHMRCQTKMSGMGDSLSVKKDNIRIVFQFAKCPEQDWRLTKRKESGNIGKSCLAHSRCLLN